MLTAEETTGGTIEITETVENGMTKVEKVIVPKTADTPVTVDEMETVKAKGWNEDPKVELLTKALRFLAAKISADTLVELESVFPTL